METLLVMYSEPPLLPPTMAPSWPRELWEMTQVASMLVVSESLHGLEPTGGTTLSVHHLPTNLVNRFGQIRPWR